MLSVKKKPIVTALCLLLIVLPSTKNLFTFLKQSLPYTGKIWSLPSRSDRSQSGKNARLTSASSRSFQKKLLFLLSYPAGSDTQAPWA